MKTMLKMEEAARNGNYESKNVIIEVKGLTKIFENKLKAVDSVSFSVYEGEIFGFLGPNGAGKSTTIKMLTTLLRPSEGDAVVCGFDLRKQPQEVRWSVGVVPQEYTADEDMTGLENIMLFANLYGIPGDVARKRADELLTLVELNEAAGRKVSTYSGGMRRRLELACGLVNHPKVLFLDEPTLGLDVQTRTAVWRYIRILKEQYGMTLFLTTHYLEEADGLCDRVGIIDHGKIVRLGTTGELKSGVGGDAIELGIREKDVDLTSFIMKVDSVTSVVRENDHYRIKASLGEEAAPAIMDAVRSAGYHVDRISLTKPTLDEVYLEYTGHKLRDEEANSQQVMAQQRTVRRARA